MHHMNLNPQKAITKLQFLDITENDGQNDDEQNDEIITFFFFLKEELSLIPIKEIYSEQELTHHLHVLNELFFILRNYNKELFEILKKNDFIFKVIDLFCGTTEAIFIEACLLILSDFSYYFIDLHMFYDIGLLEKIIGSTLSPVLRIEKISRVLLLNLITYKEIFKMKNCSEWIEIFQSFDDDYHSQIRFLYIISQCNTTEKEIIILIEYLTTIILNNKNDFYLHEFSIPALYFLINQITSDSIRFEVSKYITVEILEIILNFLDDENISSKVFSIIEILYEFNQNIIEVLDEKVFIRILMGLRSKSNYKLKVPILNFLRYLIDNSLFEINKEFQIEIHKILSEGNFIEKKYCIFLIKSMIQQSQLTYISNFYTDIMIFLFDSSTDIIIELLTIINDLLYYEESFRCFLFQNQELLEQLHKVIHDNRILDFSDCDNLIHSIDQTIANYFF